MRKAKTPAHKGVWLAILIESAAVTIIGMLFLLLLRHINTSQWKDFFFANSDMLILSQVWQSITHNEPFRWVFSSQVFFFPELPFYVLSSIFSTNFKIALLINTGLTIAVTYVLIRLILSQLSKARANNALFAVAFCSVPLLLGIAENRATQSIAMFFFSVTAYYGVILASLFSLWIIIIFLNHNSPNRANDKHKAILLSILVLIGLATGSSNPLFFLQFSAPMILTLGLLFIGKLITKGTFLLLTLSQIVSIVVGFVVRHVFLSSFLSPLGTLSNYLHPKQILATTEAFWSMAEQLLNQDSGTRFTLLIIGIFFIISLLLLLAFVNTLVRDRPPKQRDPVSALLVGFGTIAPVGIFFGAIITGNSATRYLIPLILFAPLAYIPYFLKLRIKSLAYLWVLLIANIALLPVVCAARPASAATDLASYYPASAQCMDQQLQGTPYKNGIAQYWRARVLQLNGRDNHSIEQVGNDLNRLNWLNNAASYTMYTLSFVIVDKVERVTSFEVSTEDEFTITPSAVKKIFGEPSRIFQCSDFDIYAYDDTSQGYKILNQLIINF